jgi:hypothetical protein
MNEYRPTPYGVLGVSCPDFAHGEKCAEYPGVCRAVIDQLTLPELGQLLQRLVDRHLLTRDSAFLLLDQATNS